MVHQLYCVPEYPAQMWTLMVSVFVCPRRDHRCRVATGQLVERQPQSLRGVPHLGDGAKAQSKVM